MSMRPVLAFATLLGLTMPACAAVTDRRVSGVAVAVRGDEIQLGNKRIRLAGIVAPKIIQYCRDASTKPYPCGRKSMEFLGSLIDRRLVRCSVKPDGIGSCYLGRRDLSAMMIESGEAIPARDAPATYRTLSEQAKSFRKGLWQGDFIHPDEWHRYLRRNPIVKTSK